MRTAHCEEETLQKADRDTSYFYSSVWNKGWNLPQITLDVPKFFFFFLCTQLSCVNNSKYWCEDGVCVVTDSDAATSGENSVYQVWLGKTGSWNCGSVSWHCGVWQLTWAASAFLPWWLLGAACAPLCHMLKTKRNGAWSWFAGLSTVLFMSSYLSNLRHEMTQYWLPYLTTNFMTRLLSLQQQ